MKNVFESTYQELDDNGELYECEGGISGGDMSAGSPAGPAGGITSDSVLGPSGEFEKGHGCLGKGDFHIPVPVCPMLFRYPEPCGGASKTKKRKGKKTVSVRNPYVKGMKTIVAEGENGVIAYAGQAKDEFDRVTSSAMQVYTCVLNYNDQLKLAWMVREDGSLHMYKPFKMRDYWTVYATTLQEDGTILLDYKAGIYQTEQAALDAVYKAAEKHRKALEECLRGLNERFDPRDIVKWEAHGRDPRYFPQDRRNDVNVHALTAELKQKFHGQFEDVTFKNLGGTWDATFSVSGLDQSLKGQRLVKTAIPMIDDIVRLLRIRGVETNSYDIKAVPAGSAMNEEDMPKFEYAPNGLPIGIADTKKDTINEAKAPVVSDQTIDVFSAKYYCVFADPEFQKDVDRIKNSPEFQKTANGIIRQSVERVKELAQNGGKEQLNEFILPAAALYPVIAPAVTMILGSVAAWFASKAATDAVMPMLKTSDTSVTAEAIKDTPVADLGTITVEAPAIDPAPEQPGKDGFWKWFLGTSIGGLFSAAGTFLAGLLGLGAEAAAGITMGLVSAVAVGCAMLAKHMLPVMVSWFRKLRETGVIAYTEFESDGDTYRMSYSVKDGKWRMFLVGSRLFNRRANPTPQEIQQAMGTEFFRKFQLKCSETLHEYLDDPENVLVLKTMQQQNSKNPDMKYVGEILGNRDEILARFDRPTFVSESEET